MKPLGLGRLLMGTKGVKREDAAAAAAAVIAVAHSFLSPRLS